jgi:hypothetical protein
MLRDLSKAGGYGEPPSRCKCFAAQNWGISLDGRRIADVAPQSVAEAAGLRPDLLILQINGRVSFVTLHPQVCIDLCCQPGPRMTAERLVRMCGTAWHAM